MSESIPPKAISPKHLSEITAHIAEYGDVNNYNDDGKALLHHYCAMMYNAPIELFEYLIESLGADINLKDSKRQTPIKIAFDNFGRTNNVDILLYLLNQSGIDIEETDQHGYTPLHHACLNINTIPLVVFKQLINVNKANIFAKSNLVGASPPGLALELFQNTSKSLDAIFYLLQQYGVNGNINDLDVLPQTILHRACSNIRNLPLAVFQHLIEINQIDITSLNAIRSSPTMYAFSSFRAGCDVNILYYLLSHNKVNVNHHNSMGKTIMHFVCSGLKNGNFSINMIKYLVEIKGGDLNIRNNAKNTPIHDAVDSNNHNNAQIDVLIYLYKQIGISIPQNDEKVWELNKFVQTPTYFSSFPVFGGLISRPHTASGLEPGSNDMDEREIKMVKFVLENSLIRDDIDAKKFMVWLCQFQNPPTNAIRYLCEHFVVDYDFYEKDIDDVINDKKTFFENSWMGESDQFSILREGYEDGYEEGYEEGYGKSNNCPNQFPKYLPFHSLLQLRHYGGKSSNHPKILAQNDQYDHCIHPLIEYLIQKKLEIIIITNNR
jgi:ankyrin repeat protein